MKKILKICFYIMTIIISCLISGIITFYFSNSEFNKIKKEKEKIEECYNLAKLKKEIKYQSACITGTGVIDENGCIGYKNIQSIIEEYNNDLETCLKK